MLLTSGYWGLARHFNYIGDLTMCIGWAVACFDPKSPFPWLPSLDDRVLFVVFLLFFSSCCCWRYHVRGPMVWDFPEAADLLLHLLLAHGLSSLLAR